MLPMIVRMISSSPPSANSALPMNKATREPRANSARTATNGVGQPPKASASGALERVPSSFIFVKAGLSLRVNRMITEMASRKIDPRNGMRQPPVNPKNKG